MAQEIFPEVPQAQASPSSYSVGNSGEPVAIRWELRGIEATPAGTRIIGGSIPGTRLEADPVSQEELEFWLEKEAFGSIPAQGLVPYAGEFVLSRGGRIEDHDSVLSELTRRSVERFGNSPVYIAYVGGELEFRIETPFLD